MHDGHGGMIGVFMALVALMALSLCAPALGAPAGIVANALEAAALEEQEQYDPLEATLTLDTDELTVAGSYQARVELINQGDDVIGDVTLSDDAGNVLWGPYDLDLSERKTWSGEIEVTDAMLDAGEARVNVTYVLAKGDPLYEQQRKKPVAVSVERVSMRPDLEFSRSQSMTYAQPGQRVTLTYTVKNTGNVPLVDISITDSLFGEVGTLDKLGVDEKKTFTKRVTVGSTALTSAPSVSYSYEGSQDIVQKDIAASSIKIAQPSLEVVLESDATLVNPGDTVMLRCKLINNGNVGYRKIQLSDQVLGDLGFIDDLRAGNDTVYAKSVRIQSRTTFKFTITAKDTTGSDVTAVSNSLTIDVVSETDEAGLTLSAQADKTAVYSGDTVTFTLLLCNGGSSDITGIDVMERTRGAITHVDTLRAGESMPITAQYTVTGYEMFTFVATMTQSDGATREAIAGPITISLGAATPSPAPTPTPVPTPAATMSPTTLRAYDSAINRVLTYILAAAVCLVIVLLVVVSANRARDQKRRSAARGRSARHGKRGGPRSGPRHAVPPESHEDDDVKVYVPTRRAHADRHPPHDEPAVPRSRPGKHSRR